MFWRKLRLGLLAGVLMTGAALPARADHHGHCPAPAADACAPAYKTVHVKEWVPEQYETTRTTYKTEWKEEKYTAYRTECVPETRTVTVNVMKPETRVETRTVTECVPCVEERTVMQSHVTCKPVTVMVKKCVDRGHWECREVECKPHLLERLRNHFHKQCCDPCDPCCKPCPPVRTKTVKVWCPNKVWEEVPVTRMERVCEQRPVTCKVTVNKPVTRQVQVNVTVCKCVPETRTITVNVSKCVPYEAVRKVAVCVPVTEKVTCTRMVCRTVAKQVPCAPACETTCCEKPRHGLFHRCSGLFSRSCGSCCH